MYISSVQLEFMIIQTDALVLEKAIADNPVLLPEDDKEQITVRVRSSAKTISYRLGKVTNSNLIMLCR